MRPRRLFLAAMIAVMAFGAGVRAQDLCVTEVETSSGLVRGSREKETDTCVWKGIPYAAPPVGNLRWKAPQPAPSWSGVLEATEYGSPCLQKGWFTGLGELKHDMSEDCLYLNVWRPAKPGKFPVMVWIHGGGYQTGTGHLENYWGDRLAQAGDVVVVSINYRLNIFGFMAHPSLREEDPHRSTGGYGTMDQAFALKWIQENIEAFGGDPSNVTIFGESAGGWSVCTMLATPLARGLFHRAIFESGAANASRSLDEAYEITRESFKKAGCDFNDLECMRSIPAERLLEKAAGSMARAFDYLPCEDGWVLKASPQEMIRAGDFNRVPVMGGSNLDEFAKLINLIPRYYFAMPFQYEKKIRRGMGATPEEAEKLVELYPLAEFKNSPRKAMGRMYAADAALTCPVRSSIEELADQGVPAYLYRFEYTGMKYRKILGCFHSAEIAFIFASLDRSFSKTLYKEDDNLPQAQELSRIIQAYWVNFAKTGDPNGKGLPQWQRFETDRQRIQILDTTVKNQPYDMTERCDFWEDYSMPYIETINRLLEQLNP